ncbi:MAG TPA: NAD(P)H-binding protein [Mycobacterium sp.]|nr:NAD(P)H-binding protein [Mycobacterium sp.]
MIVVTAPTGAIGRQVLARLVDGGETVRVIARDPSRIPDGVRERIEVHEGSHGDPAVVDQAFAGADAVFWLVPPDPHAKTVEAAYLDFSRPACDAVKRHGVKRVVGVSALGRGVTSNAGLVSGSLAMDDLFAETGVNYRALTMPSFMDNILRQTAALKNQGMFVGPINAERRLPTCATRDIAAVAATLLLDASWNGVAEVPILGPEDLSCNDMAGIMSDVLGKAVRYKQIPFDSYKSAFIGQGWSEAMAQGMVDMMMAKDQGLDNARPRTQQATSPTSFRQWCEEVLKPAMSKEIG